MKNEDRTLENWIEKQIGKTVVKTTPLKGGVSSLILHHKLDDRSSVVSRQIINKEWLAEEPDLIIHEKASLFAMSGETTPAFIVADIDGHDVGNPTLLMSALPGNAQLGRNVYENGVVQLAQTLHRIHQTPLPKDFEWKYASYVSIDKIQIPHWVTNRDDWEKARHFVQNSTPTFKPVFIHRDYHPTNILWNNRNLVGVVDWINACIGPALVDVAHCRINLALLFGGEMTDSFLHAYLNENNLAYTPYFDILSVFDFVDEEMAVYEGWTDLGNTELTSTLMKTRAEEYIRTLSMLIESV